jgi:hypothetical protein
MNQRHAAAAALVGWYLMVPPVFIATKKPDYTAPCCTQWSNMHSSDTAAECEQYRQAWIHAKGEGSEFSRELYMLGQCIASDDPRLKER